MDFKDNVEKAYIKPVATLQECYKSDGFVACEKRRDKEEVKKRECTPTVLSVQT